MAGKRACWSESGPWVGLWEWSGLGVWSGEVSGVCVGDVEVSDFNHCHSSLQIQQNYSTQLANGYI